MKLKDFLQFAYDNHNTRSVNISREFRSDSIIYSIVVNLELHKDTSNIQTVYYQNYYDLLVTIDTKINIITSSFGDKNITTKDKLLVEEWSKKFDELLDLNIDSDMQNLIKEAFDKCNSKDIVRYLKMKKLNI